MDLKKTQKREMKVQEVPTSNESREVLIAFSSETPVIRCINGRDYNEILLHTPEAVDLSRLLNGALYYSTMILISTLVLLKMPILTVTK